MLLSKIKIKVTHNILTNKNFYSTLSKSALKVGLFVSVTKHALKQGFLVSGLIETDLSRVTPALIGSNSSRYFSREALLYRLKFYRLLFVDDLSMQRSAGMAWRLDCAIVQMESDFSTGKLRIQPFCVVLYGKPGTGKSSFALQIAQALMKARYAKFNSTDFVTLNETDAYQSEFRSSHKVVLFDDVNAANPARSDTANPWRKVIDFVNNIQKTALNPNVLMKGKVFIKPDVVLITTNLKMDTSLRSISTYIPCYGAIVRRFSAVIEVLDHTMARKIYYSVTDGGSNPHVCCDDYDLNVTKSSPSFSRGVIIAELTRSFLAHMKDQQSFCDQFNDCFDDVRDSNTVHKRVTKPRTNYVPQSKGAGNAYAAPVLKVDHWTSLVLWIYSFVHRNQVLSPKLIRKGSYSLLTFLQLSNKSKRCAIVIPRYAPLVDSPTKQLAKTLRKHYGITQFRLMCVSSREDRVFLERFSQALVATIGMRAFLKELTDCTLDEISAWNIRNFREPIDYSNKVFNALKTQINKTVNLQYDKEMAEVVDRLQLVPQSTVLKAESSTRALTPFYSDLPLAQLILGDKCTGAFVLRSNVICIPAHFVPKEAESCKLYFRQLKVSFLLDPTRIQRVGKLDLVLVFVDFLNLEHDFTLRFSPSYLEETSQCILVGLTNDRQRYMCGVNWKFTPSVSNGHSIFSGGTYSLLGMNTFEGQCMSVIVHPGDDRCIIGFHIGGITDSPRGLGMAVSRLDLETATCRLYCKIGRDPLKFSGGV